MVGDVKESTYLTQFVFGVGENKSVRISLSLFPAWGRIRYRKILFVSPKFTERATYSRQSGTVIVYLQYYC